MFPTLPAAVRVAACVCKRHRCNSAPLHHWAYIFTPRSHSPLTDAFYPMYPPNELSAVRVTQGSDLRSGSDRSCPLSINQANECVRPCGTPQILTEECTRTHQHMWHWHIHMSIGAHTYAAHHALHVVSSILSISVLLRHVLRSHLLDVRRWLSLSVENPKSVAPTCVQASV